MTQMIYGNMAIHRAMEKAVLKQTKYSKNFFSSDNLRKDIFPLSLMKNLTRCFMK